MPEADTGADTGTDPGTDPVRYRLVRPRRATADQPVLDDAQRSVVEHRGGPLLVLAGPGTGKTTTLVQAVVDRIEREEVAPEQALVLTFSRKAAGELRDRITARIGRTLTTPLASTFHSFCYALVRRFQPPETFTHPLQLLSAAEQDVRIRDLLEGDPTARRVEWPADLGAALGTRGFAEEVRAVLARTRELGLDPEDLARIGEQTGRPEWAAVGSFFEEYLDVLDAQGLLDYAELVHRAVLLAEDPEVRAVLRREFRCVFVDEYQDTDPAQVRLLQAIAGDGRDLVAVGDPDQSIYAFRGADVRGLLTFPDRFRDRAGHPAPVVPLTTTRRFGPALLAASRRVADRMGAPAGLDRDAVRRFRQLEAAAPPEYGDGSVEVFTCTSSGAEQDHIADLLRRAHLADGVAWSEMAVLVRSGTHSIPGLRRALVAAGVPVEVAGDEVPLRLEPAVQPLLVALAVAADPDSLTEEQAHQLLVSPLGGLDGSGVRRLARRLRSLDREQRGEGALPRPSAQLLREALTDTALLDALIAHGDPGEGLHAGERPAQQARRLVALIQEAHAQLADGEPAEQALWTLWRGTRWPQWLRAGVDGGGASARAAHRDLDAICALFELAARSEERSEHRGVANFLAEVQAQQIPADTLADTGSRGEAVRLLTAHRSKGLQWRLVVVAGVQDGAWPDLRRRGSLLQPDRLSADGLAEPPTTAAMLAEERRLFYVAVTRARERLVVTAVASPDSDGDQPSRFVGELGVEVGRRSGRPSQPMSLAGVVGSLRRFAGDPAVTPALREAAARRLARLADARAEDGTLLVPVADPDRWWGGRPATHSEVPVRGPEPLQLSASAIESLDTCPLRWFLQREARGAVALTTALGFGRVIHVLADQVARGELPAEPELLVAQLEGVWEQLRFGAAWISRRERDAAEQALGRFAAWHRHSAASRRLVATEYDFRVELTVAGEPVVIRGAMDRVEVDADGAVVVVDLKTGKTAVTAQQAADHIQLGVYQLAVAAGAADELVEPPARPAGAELVYVRTPKRSDSPLPKVLVQPALDDPGLDGPGPDPTVSDPTGPDDTGPDDQLAHVDQRPAAAQEQDAGPRHHVEQAVHTIRRERFWARTNKFCDFCEFAGLCPTRPEGQQLLAPDLPDGGERNAG